MEDQNAARTPARTSPMLYAVQNAASANSRNAVPNSIHPGLVFMLASGRIRYSRRISKPKTMPAAKPNTAPIRMAGDVAGPALWPITE